MVDVSSRAISLETTKAAPRRGRWYLAAILGGLVLAEFVVMVRSTPAADFGTDFRFFVGVGQRFLEDGSYYLPRQLTGETYALLPATDVMYPPTALLLFVPTAILGAAFWWGVPVVVTLYVLWWLRPSALAVCAMLVLLAWPRAMGAYLFGSTDIWMAAFVAGGIRWGWPTVLLVLKPTLLPLALLGLRRRSWWIVAGLLAAVSLPMLPLWLDYLTAARNLQIDPTYSLGSLPLLMVPVVGWLGVPRAPHADRVVDVADDGAIVPDQPQIGGAVPDAARPQVVVGGQLGNRLGSE
jgi:hypothetical protein